MKKYAVLAAGILVVSASFAGQIQNAQLAVQNDSGSPVSLKCVTRSDVIITGGGADAKGKFNLVVPAEGASRNFTFTHFSKNEPLMKCTVEKDSASFAYYALTKEKETMAITPSVTGHNFTYNPDYTGSVVYQ